MVYPAVLLALGQGIVLLPTMVWCIQSGLWALTKTFCKVEAPMDADCNALTDQHGDHEVKIPNLRIELSYTYLVIWLLCIAHL